MSIMKTKLTELLGIELPILGGTMMDLSTAEFVAPISEADTSCSLIRTAIFWTTPGRVGSVLRASTFRLRTFWSRVMIRPRRRLHGSAG